MLNQELKHSSEYDLTVIPDLEKLFNADLRKVAASYKQRINR